MGWIMMQPSNDAESIRATEILRKPGEYVFDLTRNGAHLRPTGFGSRCCLEQEKKYHSFVGEAACRIWVISQNRRFLWRSHFWWMCDYKSIKEVLEYDGTISIVCRWEQELLGYHYTCLHWPARMMVDVNGLTRRFGPVLTNYMCVAVLLHSVDVKKRLNAYESTLSAFLTPTKLVLSKELESVSIPILTKKTIDSYSKDEYSRWETEIISPRAVTTNDISESICSVPILLCHTPPVQLHNSSEDKDKETISGVLDIADKSICNWICIDDTVGAFRS